MAVTHNAKGTSFPSFKIGKNGVTIYQGTATPLNINGQNGDMYFQAGVTPALWQKVDNIWNKIGNFGSKIFTDNTSVDTNEEIGAITVNVNDKRVMDIIEDVASVGGEKFTFSIGNGELKIISSDTDGTEPVDLVVELQATGAFKIKSDTESAIRSDGSDITVQPGEKTTGVGGGIFLRGGDTTQAGSPGGNINLIPGSGGSGSAAAQVVVPSGYVATTDNSVVNRFSLTNWSTAFVTSASSYNILANDQLVLVDRTGATSVVLPVSGIVVGHIVKIKAARSDATVTVTAASGLIDADNSVVLNGWGFGTFAWDGTRWLKV